MRSLRHECKWKKREKVKEVSGFRLEKLQFLEVWEMRNIQ